MRIKTFLTTIVLLAAAAVQARTLYRLDDGWRFYFATENSGDNARTVTLPHSWSRGVMTAATGNYDRTIYVPSEWEGRRLFLRFGAAQSVADVFVNGAYAGGHKGAYTAFAMEITDLVRYGDENLIHVVVSNAWRSDVLPVSTRQNIGGGLTRGVELLVTGETAVSPLYYGTEGVLVHHKQTSAGRADAEAEVRITSRHSGTCDVTLRVTDPSGYVAVIRRQRSKGDGDRAVRIPFSVDMPLQWSTGAGGGRLYDVTAVVVPDGDTEKADTVSVTTGFRTIEASAGGGFRIGGEKVRLRGVRLMHDSFGGGAVQTAADYERDMALIKELGANAVRSEGGPHGAELYDLCDREGIVAWIDLPMTQTPFLSDMAFFDSPAFRENGTEQLHEIILQNMNHPSVAMWGIFSLLQPRGERLTEYVRELKSLAAALDPSRPTVACSNRNGELNFISDLIVWQQNIGWERGMLSDVNLWRDKLRSDWTHLASGVSYGEEGDVEIQREKADRKSGDSEARQTQMHEEYAAALCDDAMFWGVWLNSLADYASVRQSDGVVNTGLVTADRTIRKDAFYLYKALWNPSDPTLYIASRRLRQRSSAPQRLTVYSSVGEPVMTVGRDTVAMEQLSRCRYRSAEFKPEAGSHTVRVTAGGLEDSMEISVMSPLVRP